MNGLVLLIVAVVCLGVAATMSYNELQRYPVRTRRQQRTIDWRYVVGIVVEALIAIAAIAAFIILASSVVPCGSTSCL
jgi:hypothetical protein